MRISKFAGGLAIASAVSTLALSGAALAATGDISNTGPGSNNEITVETTTHVDIANHNDISVTNNNYQTATTGDADVNHNTTAGDASTGDASNQNTTTTSISINNDTLSGGAGGGSGGGSNGGNGNGNGSGTGGGSLGSTSTTSSSGSTGGTGGGTLPETGASSPIDVSALRNLLSPTSALTHGGDNNTTSLLLLTTAALLSLGGAIGSAVYSTKRTLKV